MTPQERDDIEGRFTSLRQSELQQRPVHGSYDADHLKEINRRIFQDLPRIAGFEGVTPGRFRPPVPEGKEWMKQRGLSTMDGPFFVAYSRMDEAAQARLDQALAGAKPAELRALDTEAFTRRIGRLYAELDHAHPFADGNSRTLRTFISQLARDAGYAIDWDGFARSPAGRDLLYIARDLSVNEIAMPLVRHPDTLKKIIHTRSRLEGHRALPELLRDAVRPRRG
ncbi:Fic family protein [Variovorax sp. PvP013]|uniref:Fic family protein n=1 Tax=Variovorax sp. PvP013 TaxID=3156435 RepID=UPI003D24D6F7